METGFIIIHRKITENWLWLSEPFSKAHAWLDLLLLANHTEGSFFIRGVKIIVKRGVVARSEETLAERWRWSRNKVRSFIKLLENEQQIKQHRSNVLNTIEIINYDLYQKLNNKKDNKKTTEGQQKDTNNEELINDNNDNNDNEEILIESQFESFWQSYKAIHTGKGVKDQAKESFKKALKASSFEEIEQGLKSYMADCHSKNIYTKQVSVWLNKHGWKGEYSPTSAKPQSKHGKFEEQDYYAGTEGFEVC
jgi:hypothetical protein